MGKQRDPGIFNTRSGNMLSVFGRAKHQVAEDDNNFNAATMGNRMFKVLPKKAMKSPTGYKATKSTSSSKNSKRMGYARAAQRKLGTMRKNAF